jgi:MSHA biogenesis protein MshO
VDAARRAELTDIADTALRRITRDLRTALPNSVRVDVTGKFMEFLQTSGGGRYRASLDSTGAGNILDFTTTDASFDVIGPMPTFAGGESIVIYNLSSDPAITTANAYDGDNRASYDSTAGSTINLNPGKQFPFPSPGQRFQVVQYPVTYGCNLGTGQVTRYWSYGIASAQATPPVGGSSALLATGVTECSFSYSTSGATGRTGIISLTLTVERSGEKVRLFQQVHVSNIP